MIEAHTINEGSPLCDCRICQGALQTNECMERVNAAWQRLTAGYPKGDGLGLLSTSAIAHVTKPSTCQTINPAKDKVTVRTLTDAMSVLPTSRAAPCPNILDGLNLCRGCEVAGVGFCILAALAK